MCQRYFSNCERSFELKYYVYIPVCIYLHDFVSVYDWVFPEIAIGETCYGPQTKMFQFINSSSIARHTTGHLRSESHKNTVYQRTEQTNQRTVHHQMVIDMVHTCTCRLAMYINCLICSRWSQDYSVEIHACRKWFTEARLYWPHTHSLSL